MQTLPAIDCQSACEHCHVKTEDDDRDDGDKGGRRQQQTRIQHRHRCVQNPMFCVSSGGVELADSALNRFLYRAIQDHVLPPSLLPLILRNVRAIIFPENTIGPPAPPPPSPDEMLQIRRKAADDVLSLFPASICRQFFAADTQDAVVNEVETGLLDVFSDDNMNKHLIYGILELTLVRLLPELADKSPGELLAERGIIVEKDKQ